MCDPIRIVSEIGTQFAGLSSRSFVVCIFGPFARKFHLNSVIESNGPNAQRVRQQPLHNAGRPPAAIASHPAFVLREIESFRACRQH